jgi:hypothetical protein
VPGVFPYPAQDARQVERGESESVTDNGATITAVGKVNAIRLAILSAVALGIAIGLALVLQPAPHSFAPPHQAVLMPAYTFIASPASAAPTGATLIP